MTASTVRIEKTALDSAPASNPETAPNAVFDAMMRLLLEGVRQSNSEIQSTCRKALVGLGEKSMSFVEEAAKVATGQHAQRLREIAAEIRDASSSPWDESQLVHVERAYLLAVRSCNDEMWQLAIAAYALMGQMGVDYLIDRAIDEIKQPKTCLRLLAAAVRTGQKPSRAQAFAMCTLERSKNPAIAECARQLSSQIDPTSKRLLQSNIIKP